MEVGALLHIVRPVTAEQAAEVAEVERLEAELLGLLANLAKHHPAGGREFALAKTNLQQARFWAIEGITA
ncbi:hypothetical protein OVA11_14230 [Caulobacter sp. SL161]|uniref:Acb2/Tad1 domain-containing protein n=1 Tax=Caulobacter sp. SL161 TaxID=2995156 RepID=UPI0022725489|nr:hypothetical protein [Caulobacter sp. SL161]MCY1648178.1 hypothetical protein [Caulobacter sp. SL161]